MQLVFVRDLKKAVSERRDNKEFEHMLGAGYGLGRIMKRSMETGVAENPGQYVRVPKYFLDETFEYECSDDVNRMLILLSLWICAFSSGKGHRIRLDTVSITFDVDKDYLISLVEKYGEKYGLRKIRSMIPSGRSFDFIKFEDPRNVTRNEFINIF